MDLKRLFHPRSIAVVGASPNLGGGKLPYYQVLKGMGYKGELYPVHPKHTEIDGARIFPSLSELPGPVDLAIVQVPARSAVEVMRDVVRNRIPFVHFFTSGFAEIGNTELEHTLVEIAREGGSRIVGPNCLGVMCSESNLTFSPHARVQDGGKVAFLGQSGGLSENFVSLIRSRGIATNKAVSYGNQADLKAEDYLAYFGADDQITVICAYIEDVKNGRRFLEVLKQTARKKPVIILKGGSTTMGAKAAASHTGAMAGAHEIFSALLKQAGCIEVDTLERMADVVMLAVSEQRPRGDQIAYVVGGGGASVVSTDVASRYGFTFPELQANTQQRIAEKIMDVNTSTHNPVDLGAFAFSPDILLDTLAYLGEDDRVDLVVPQFTVGSAFLKPTYEQAQIDRLVAKLKKPLIPVVSRMSENKLKHEEYRINLITLFRNAGLPVYNTISEACYAIRKLLDCEMGSGL